MIKKIAKWAIDGLCVLLIVALVLYIGSSLKARKNPQFVPGIGPYKIMLVLSGSMRPVLEPGDMIVSRVVDAATLKEGDIVTFRPSKDMLVTHRITGKKEDGSFITKGDANNTEDSDMRVDGTNIIAKYLFRIPKGGYVSKFLKTPIGLIIFILLPVGILAGGEIKNIFKELDDDEKSQEQKDENIES